MYREAVLRPGAMRSMVNYYRAALRGARSSAAEDLGTIDTPTLMIWVCKMSRCVQGDDERNRSVRQRPHDAVPARRLALGATRGSRGGERVLLAWFAGEPVPESSEIVAERLAEPAVPG